MNFTMLVVAGLLIVAVFSVIWGYISRSNYAATISVWFDNHWISSSDSLCLQAGNVEPHIQEAAEYIKHLTTGREDSKIQVVFCHDSKITGKAGLDDKLKEIMITRFAQVVVDSYLRYATEVSAMPKEMVEELKLRIDASFCPMNINPDPNERFEYGTQSAYEYHCMAHGISSRIKAFVPLKDGKPLFN